MRLLFFTTSTYSDIQAVQAECIKKFFPEHEHIIIDGRTGWFSVWYDWLHLSYKNLADYYIHIDEDCFITSEKEIYKLIEKMESESIDIAGPPDGHYEYRSGNHMAFNSFFMIMKRSAIDAWFSRTNTPQFNPEWIEEYPYDKSGGTNYEYNMEFGSSGKPVGLIWKPETEPYYDFMWVLKEAGLKFHYLEPTFGKEFQTTNLLNDSIIHMWHQRERMIDGIVSPLHSMTNRSRFDGVISKIKSII